MRLYSAAMGTYPRFAIYYAPAHGSALDRFGAHMLGYDARSGEDLPFPDGVTPDWRDLTADPREYGFHATLKAPFFLAEGKTETDLISACSSFADTVRAIPLIKPIIDSISGFIAIVRAESAGELEQLAADCVFEFDPFRAPLTAEDRTRRNPARLTPRQCEYLDRWGYPYVMEEFRFHMTLTGRLEAERRGPIVTMLRQHFAEIGLATLAIDRIALFRQNDPNSRFGIISEWQLRARTKTAT